MTHCEDFVARIDALLDQRASLANNPELSRHAENCSACHELLQGYETLFQGVAERPPLQLSDDLAERVLADRFLANGSTNCDSPSGVRVDGVRVDGVRVDGVRVDGVRVDGVRSDKATPVTVSNLRERPPASSSPPIRLSQAVLWLAPMAAAASVLIAALLFFGDRQVNSTNGPTSGSLASGEDGSVDPFEEFADSFSGFDTESFRVDSDRIVTVGLATGRTMARLPEKMQLAASNSVSATLEALRRPSSEETTQEEQPISIPGKTSKLWSRANEYPSLA